MIEIIAATPEDAGRIHAFGGDRIELVSALSEGGLTPSYGLIRQVVKSVSIPVNVIIRPHSKGFTYTTGELEVMKEDIRMARELGANGVVLGTLTADNKICAKSLESLLAECSGLDVTFHKAIDEVADPVAAVEILAHYPQITTILTSGGHGEIAANTDAITAMMERAGAICIMPGGGLTVSNLNRVRQAVGASWYHFGSAVRTNSDITDEINPAMLHKVRELADN